jgi:hypothetical protein
MGPKPSLRKRPSGAAVGLVSGWSKSSVETRSMIKKLKFVKWNRVFKHALFMAMPPMWSKP